MTTTTIERSAVRTDDGDYLPIAEGTDVVVSYGEMLESLQKFWEETKSLVPNYSVVEEFLIEKRIEVERDNREFDL
ncbi:MAG: hypothetical protein LIP23_00955 [Planctomycetes bacterium]|nr:hypothetical protein [Planctomycetota bacterium]